MKKMTIIATVLVISAAMFCIKSIASKAENDTNYIVQEVSNEAYVSTSESATLCAISNGSKYTLGTESTSATNLAQLATTTVEGSTPSLAFSETPEDIEEESTTTLLPCTEEVVTSIESVETTEEETFFDKLIHEFGGNFAKSANAINAVYDELSANGDEVNSEDVFKALGYDYAGQKTGRPVSDAEYSVNDWTILVNHEQIYDDNDQLNAGIVMNIRDNAGVEMTIAYGVRGVEVYTNDSSSIFGNVMLGEVSDYRVIRSAVSQRINREKAYYDTYTLATLLCVLNTCAAS